MSRGARDDRKAIADRLRELALLVETGCAETTAVSLLVSPGRRHHKIEIVEPMREPLNEPTAWVDREGRRVERDPTDTAA